MKHARHSETGTERNHEAWLARLRVQEGDDAQLGRALDYALNAGPNEPVRPQGVDVALILHGIGADQETLIAAVLGDPRLREQLTTEQIEQEFGVTIAKLVQNIHWLNTFKDCKGETIQAPEQAERLRRMLLAMVDDVRAVLIKLAYRIERLRILPAEGYETRRCIARETLDIYSPLANRLGVGQLKWEMEDLAFRYLEPQVYKRIAKSLEETRTERETYIKDFIARLRLALKEEGVEAEVLGRPKHIHSIWRKMQRKRLDVDELYDLRAVRVVVDKIANCYAVLGVVHGLWKHVPKEFDDYIAHPKENGYQSLHTAVIGPEGKTVEIQIRTQEMHIFAEQGVAAHWRYKEGGRQDTALERAIGSLRQLLENKTNDAELLEDFHSDLFPDRVFALTPQGDVMDLPKGATPLDFAYQVHTEVGHRCRGAKVDGRIVPLTYQLNSGEHVEILTAKEAAPRRDWMNPNMAFLKTASARGKVRHWFRQQDHDQNLADGKTLLEREAHRLGAEPVDVEALTRHFHLQRTEDLLIALGRGDISAAQLTSALSVPELPKDIVAERAPARTKGTAAGEGEIHIQGVGNLMTQFAQCCKPVPGDAIIGYITLGKGVSIHRQDCANILGMPPSKAARLIEVNWGDEAEAYPVDIRIEAFDRQGLLRDITSVLANDKINVLAANTYTDKKDQSVKMDLTLEISGAEQLGAVLDKLNQLRNVIEVRRRG